MKSHLWKLTAHAALLLTTLLILAGASVAGPLPQVVIVATGGTIAETKDPASGALKPALSGESLIKAVSGLEKLARIRVVQLCNIDSSHMTPAIWARLSRKVDAILADPKVAGVVVTHGTDTMALGAFFLELTLASPKPVVFTGSMRGAGALSADGPENIYNAVLEAVSTQGRDWGVTVTLNQYICAAGCARKTHTNNAFTFKCGEQGFLGYVDQGRVFRLSGRRGTPKLPLADKLPPVALVTTYAGDDGALLRAVVAGGAKGIVLEALGAGNVGKEAAQAVAHALAKGVTVVITTRVPHGPVTASYGDVGGGAWLQEKGAILSTYLRGGKARLLLMLALANGKKPTELRQLFN